MVDKRDTQYLARREDFRLGNAEIRPSVRTVHGPEGSAAAEPRVMQVLLALADAKGAVVTRDDLIHMCWKGQIVGDDAINRAIKEVRRIARVTAAGFGVETIPRIGFRLVEDDIADPRQQASDAGLVTPPTQSEGKFMRRAVLAGALTASVGGLVVWNSRSKPIDPAERLIDESQIVMRSGTPATDRQAIGLLERAITLSPNNSRAWGLLALTRARVDEHATDKTLYSTADIETAAQRALALDANNADAQAARALAIPYYGDWTAAERRYDEILALHRDHVFTRDSRIFFLGAVGRMRESARERVALTDDAPFDANLHFRHIYGLWFLGRIPEADRAAARGLEMWPRHPGIWFARLWVLSGTGRFDRALAQIADEAGRPQLPPPMIETLQASISAAQSKDPSQVSAAVNRVMLGVSGSVAAVVNAMMLLNLMGATDQAFDLAEAYYLERGPIIAAMQWRPGQPVVPDQRRRKTNMLFTPTAAPMQRDPRFMPLMRQMGLADYWDRRGVVPDFQAARPR